MKGPNWLPQSLPKQIKNAKRARRLAQTDADAFSTQKMRLLKIQKFRVDPNRVEPVRQKNGGPHWGQAKKMKCEQIAKYIREI